MSSANHNDSNEESYSMYPKTSSPPPPPNQNSGMHFPAYQAAVPMYAYPQTPYMYAGQLPGYPFNMMGQNQMLYQHNGIPQASSGDSKKKWNNASGGMTTTSKVNNYHNHQHSASYHPQTSSNFTPNAASSFTPANKSPAPTTNTTTPTATTNTTTNTTTSIIKYKFEISKLNVKSEATASISFPLFFNTTEEDFASARAVRHQLRKDSLNNVSSAITYAVESFIDKDSSPSMELEFIRETIPTLDTKEEEAKHDQTLEAAVEKPAIATQLTPTPTPTPTPTLAPAPPPPPPPKSWSAIASGAISKSKASTSAQSSAIIGSSQIPQKKYKRYVPSSTVGIEPLGSISLRMCFDPDYINYTIKNNEKTLPIKSIIPRGIVNRANICFMSSVLQVLVYCKPFVNILNLVSTKNNLTKIDANSRKLIDATVAIYKQFDKVKYQSETEMKSETKDNVESRSPLFAPSQDAIDPDNFYKILSTLPKFKDLKWGHQEDAEEFLTHLLDQLHEEFIAVINALTDNEIQNLLNSIIDEELKMFFIRNLPQYKKADFIKNPSAQLKTLMTKHGIVGEDNDIEGNGWQEVSGTSKKGKKTKTAAKRTVEIEPSPISNLFGGQFRSVLDIPNNKESQSITLDPFQTIQLDISDPGVENLETAFKKFSEFELLPFKSSSGNDVEAKKQTFIDRLPQVLLIQLKRFSFINTDRDNNMMNYNAYNGRIEKIRKKIRYEHELTIPIESLSPASESTNSRKYSLTGVIYHHGLSSDGGHYTADVHHKELDKWFRIDDITITGLEKDDVLKGGEDGADSRTAYILMYQKI